MLVRFASLALILRKGPENRHGETEEAPMEQHAKLMMSSFIETVWALGVSAGAGLLPLT